MEKRCWHRTSDKLLTTGGFSEMVAKRRRWVSWWPHLSTPTDRAVLLAEKLGIAIVGCSERRPSVYSTGSAPKIKLLLSHSGSCRSAAIPPAVLSQASRQQVASTLHSND